MNRVHRRSWSVEIDDWQPKLPNQSRFHIDPCAGKTPVARLDPSSHLAKPKVTLFE
jgi:hypothetical protein